MRGHFRYLRFKTFPVTPRTPQCEVFWALLSSSEHSGVPEDSNSSLFPSVGLHPHTWPKWGCDKLELPKNLKVHPTFHVSISKPVSRDASRPNRENNSRPPPDLVHNEPEFEVEAVLKSRQLRGREREYLVKWKGYHPIEASWVNESDTEHAQEAIEEFHARPTKKRRRT